MYEDQVMTHAQVEATDETTGHHDDRDAYRRRELAEFLRSRRDRMEQQIRPILETFEDGRHKP